MNASSSSPSSPKRRWFLRAGLAVGGAVALFGGTVFWRRGIVDNKLTEPGAEVIRAVAAGVLDDVLPAEAGARTAALDAHLKNMSRFLGNVPPMLRTELSVLLGALANTAGRTALTGMVGSWSSATPHDVQRALEHMRMSPLETVQMVYHALRDINTITFYSSSDNWKSVGYPGPLDI
ncbi:MAG: hypothetical protein EPO01_01065 [Aquabacterium sp.]|nr:MAG: hypothetical protein EPO01_01065 [Aquabacterium sp.]